MPRFLVLLDIRQLFSSTSDDPSYRAKFAVYTLTKCFLALLGTLVSLGIPEAAVQMAAVDKRSQLFAKEVSQWTVDDVICFLHSIDVGGLDRGALKRLCRGPLPVPGSNLARRHVSLQSPLSRASCIC